MKSIKANIVEMSVLDPPTKLSVRTIVHINFEALDTHEKRFGSEVL